MVGGRLATGLKLSTGSCSRRQASTSVVSTAGVLSAAVIAGHDRDCAAAMASVNQADRRSVCGVASASRSTARSFAATSPSASSSWAPARGHIGRRV